MSSKQEPITVMAFSEVRTCRIVNQDCFGPEHHYAVSWPDSAGNWHYGWVPGAFFIRLPEGVRVEIKALVEHPEGLLL